MRYLIDIHSSPPVVVLVHDDVERIAAVAQVYADQVRRPLVVAVGPAPHDAQVRPYVPSLAVEVQPGATGVNVAESAELQGHIAPGAARAIVSYDPDHITPAQRAALAALGIKL